MSYDWEKALTEWKRESPPQPVEPTPDAMRSAAEGIAERELRGTLDAAKGVNPDTRAKALRLGQGMGLPTDLVERNIDELSSIDEIDRAAGKLLANPRLRAWFAQPDNAAVARDSVDALLDVARAVPGDLVLNTVGTTLSGTGEGWQTIGRTLARPAYAGLDAIGLGDAVRSVQVPWFLAPSEIFGRPGQTIKDIGTAIGPAPENRNLATDIAGGVGQVGGQIALALLAPQLSLLALLAQGADQQADQARESGAYGTPEADAAIVAGAGVTALTEKLGLDLLLNRVPPAIKNRVLRQLTDVGLAGGIEAVQEAVEGLGHNLVTYAFYDPDHPLFEGLDREAAAAGGTGVIVRGIINALTPGRTHMRLDQQAGQAEQQRDAIVSARDAADRSPLAERSPEALQDAVRAMVGGDTTVQIPVSAAVELNQSPVALAEALGVSDQVEEAMATGGDFVVPVERLMTLPRETFDLLADHFRVNDGLTVSEARTLGEDRQTAADDVAERAAIQAEDTSSAEAITRSVFEQMRTAGQAPEAARRNAAAIAQRYVTRAERRGLGEDPFALFLADNLSIVGPMPAAIRDAIRTPDAIDRALNELRQGSKKPGKTGTPALDIIRRLGGVQIGSQLDTELRAMGVTPQTRPGLFRKKGGIGDVDNLVWSEEQIWQDNTQPDPNGYVPRQAVLDAVSREIAGDPLMPATERAALNEQVAQREALEALLDRARVDVNSATNDQIRQALAAMERDAVPPSGALEQAQREGLGKDTEIWHGKLRDLVRGKLPEAFDLRVGAVPPVLRAIGVQAGQMVFRGSKIRKVIAEHPDIGKSSLLDLPSLIADPDLIYEESAASGKSSDFVVVTKNRSANGAPVAVAIKAEGTSNKGDRATIVLTVYPLDRGAEKITEVIAAGRLRYARDGRVTAGYEHTGANSLNGLPKQPSNPKPAQGLKVVTADDVVKKYQKLYQGGGDGPRGTFARETLADGSERNVIRLTQAADLSSFLHESGHLFAFQLIDDAFDARLPADARARMQVDLQAWVDWVGLDVKVQDVDAATLHGRLTVEHHEQFARGFEAYLMEGNAPSVGLRDLFRRFAAWLTMIYRSSAGLRVNLTPEVRRVMDRLLATDEEIAQAESDMAFTALDAKRLGMTEAEGRRYADAVTKARDEAREKLTRALIDEIRRERTKWWREEEAKVRDEVTAEIRQRPAYTALLAFQRGENPAGEKLANHFRLDKAVLVEAYGEQWVKDYLRPLRVYAVKDGLDPDLAAGMLGFDSADAMVQAMVNATPLADAVKAETEAEMKRRHGDMLSDGSIADAALAAVEGDAQARLLTMEIRALKRAGLKDLTAAAERGVQERGASTAAEDQARVAQAEADVDQALNVGAGIDAAVPALAREEAAKARAKAGVGQRRAQASAIAQVRQLQAALDPDALRQAAARIIRQKKVDQAVSPARYEAVAARLGQQAERAIAARRYADAAMAKEQQLLNLFLAREARDAREKVEKIVSRMDKFLNPRAKWNIDQDYLDHIRMLLNAYQFGARLSDAKRGQLQLEAFYAWVQRQQEGDAGAALDIPPEVVAADNLVHYREMELERLYALADSVEFVYHAGVAQKEWEIGEEKRELDQMVAEGTELIRANVKERPRPALADDRKWTVRARKGIASAIALLTKVRTWIEEMDGFQKGGWWGRHVLTPIREAEVARLHRLRSEAEVFGKIVEKHYGASLKGLPRDWNRKIFINERVGSIRKDQIVAVALNWGNEDGRQRLMDQKARKWTQGDIEMMLDHMEARDWRFVQDVWDYLNGFWPEIAALERKRKGVVPEKVAPLAFSVRGDGGAPMQMRGGYYPLKYDGETSTRASENEIEAAFKGMQAGRFASAQTRRGHTKERLNSAGGMSLLLDLDVIRGHVDQVVTDLTMWQPIRSTWKLLTHHRVKEAIEETFGVEVNRQLDLWIKDVAVGKPLAGDIWSRVFANLRHSASAAAMGWKVSTTLVQISGYVQSVVELGPRWSALGLTKFIGSPAESIKTVERLSPFMRERAYAFQRDLLDAIERARGKGLLSGIQATLFWPIVKMQRFVDIPTWIGAYNKGVAEGRTDEDAARLADDFVEASQGGGLMSTLSAIERGTLSQNQRLSEWVRLWTFMYSYFNTKLNVALRRTRGADFRDGGQVAQLAADYLMLFVVEAALGNIILGQWPGDDDDEEWSWLKWTLGLAGGQAMSTIPGLREVASGIAGFTPQTPVERSLSALADFAGAARSVVGDIYKGETPNWLRLVKTGIEAGNVASPIKFPVGQIKQIITGMERNIDGDGDWIDFLIWRPREKD